MVRALTALLPLAALGNEGDESALLSIKKKVQHHKVKSAPQLSVVGTGLNCGGGTGWLGSRSVEQCQETCQGKGYSRFKHASGVDGVDNGQPGSDHNCACCSGDTTSPAVYAGMTVYEVEEVAPVVVEPVISPFTGECPAGYEFKTGKPGGQPLGGGMAGYIDRAVAFATCEGDDNCCAVSETNHPGNDANMDTGDKFRLGTCSDTWEEHAKWNSCVEQVVEQVVVEQPEVAASYVKIDSITDGLAAEATCEELGHHTITTVDECAAAYQALGLSPNSGAVTEKTEVINRPAGCTWHAFGNVEFWHQGTTGCGPYQYNCLCIEGDGIAQTPEPVNPDDDPDDDGPLPSQSLELTNNCTEAQELMDQAAAKSALKAARQARRAFNKAYFRSKRDCSSIVRYSEYVDTTDYVKIDSITDGLEEEATCEELGHKTITTVAECEAAYQALELSPKSGAVTEIQNTIDRPYGCTWHKFGNVEFWHKGTTACGPLQYNCLCVRAPCECQPKKFDDNGVKLKRRERFAHCDHNERSKNCKNCEKSAFLKYIGIIPNALNTVAEAELISETEFQGAVAAGDIVMLRKGGNRVHPQQAMRALNNCWEDARCDCVSATQECDEGMIVNKETGVQETLTATARQTCKLPKMQACVGNLTQTVFSDK